MEQYDCLAGWYDFFFDPTTDLDFYLTSARRELGPYDAMLEVGCGTGRVLAYLAARGIHCVGVDISSAMLERATGRLRQGGPEAGSRVRLRRGDMRSLALGEQFRLVIAAWSTFFELSGPEERRQALARMYNHLQPHGLLILDCSVYDIGKVGWGRSVPPPPQSAPKTYTGDGYDLKCVETRTFDEATYRLDVTVTIDGRRGEEPVFNECTCTLYYATPESVRAELFAAGFSQVDTIGYYDGIGLYDPSHAADGRQIHLARKA